jgi:hypothetical protein
MELCKPCIDRGFISEATEDVKGTAMCGRCKAGHAPSETHPEQVAVVTKDEVPADRSIRGRAALLLAALKTLPVGKALRFAAGGKGEHCGASTACGLRQSLKRRGLRVATRAQGKTVWVWRVA